MHFGVFDLYKIGVGPSSSHTVGPMKAAKVFVERVLEDKAGTNIAQLQTELYGSLALTGLGHGTDTAVALRRASIRTRYRPASPGYARRRR